MASKKHRVLLYTLSEDAMLADAILDGCGVRDQIELVGVPHDIFVPITEGAPDELERGCDAIVNEIAGISEAGAPAVAASGARLFASLSIGVNHIATDAPARASWPPTAPATAPRTSPYIPSRSRSTSCARSHRRTAMSSPAAGTRTSATPCTARPRRRSESANTLYWKFESPVDLF